jgi:DNA-binding response OmpR family regulator
MAAPILVVDDDEVLGRILIRVLGRYGYEAILATDTDLALLLARQHSPRLALVDLCMPGMDGVELGRLLRAAVPGVTLIMMTAYPLRLREHQSPGTDFAHVLVKPLDLAVLRKVIAAVLPTTANGSGTMHVC